MTTMTQRERFIAALNFQPVDRVPAMDFGYWDETIMLWREQGLPAEVTNAIQAEDYFGLDRGYEFTLSPDGRLFPLFEPEVLEDHGEKVLMRDQNGVTLWQNKGLRTIPQYVRFPVENRADYEALKWRLDGADPKRYPDNWDQLVCEKLASGHPVGVGLMGFFGWPRELMGLENLSIAYYEQPDLIHQIAQDHLAFEKARVAKALDDIKPDYASFWEDMAYKGGSLISPRTFREFMTPYYQELTGYLRAHGVGRITVDCDGDVCDLTELFIEAGIDVVLPCERQSGSDPLELRRRYPGVGLIGGVDKKAIIAGPKAIDKELARLKPLIAEGGFIPGVDHRVPPDTPMAHYRYYCERRQALVRGEL